jgi:invasion protein IalB
MFERLLGLRLLVVASIAGIFCVGSSRANELASPPIDVSILRDGEVTRTTGNFGAWTLVCDEVPRLRQRFCSLSTELRDTGGQIVATLIVSTGDDGRPAALLRAPFGVSIGSGLLFMIEPPTSAGASKTAEGTSRRLEFVRCEQDACLAVWSLTAKEIIGLTAGGALRLRCKHIQSVPPFAFHVVTPQNSITVEAATPGGGFAEAVQASLK